MQLQNRGSDKVHFGTIVEGSWGGCTVGPPGSLTNGAPLITMITRHGDPMVTVGIGHGATLVTVEARDGAPLVT